MEADEDVIIVSVNYRLGALGYLCLEDEKTVAGNMGSLDQIAALQWVQGHISHFGGDPDRVTIFGESAGGFSICWPLLMFRISSHFWILPGRRPT